nr:isoform 2 of 3-hydroxyisobutyryl-coa hydrolase 1 [Quercus suber]
MFVNTSEVSATLLISSTFESFDLASTRQFTERKNHGSLNSTKPDGLLVLVEEKLSARILTLNRPKQLNALSFQMKFGANHSIQVPCVRCCEITLKYK